MIELWRHENRWKMIKFSNFQGYVWADQKYTSRLT